MTNQDCFHDECGVFGIASHPEAARHTYLGLYALQHRGQESAGIVSTDGTRLYQQKGMGHVAEVFDDKKLAHLIGDSAIGHVRYSTSGESALSNAQPVVTDSRRGPIALAHNGNLVNSNELRRKLESEGAIFQSTTDTEVVSHLLARSPIDDVDNALYDILLQLRGGYSILMQTRQKQLYAIRDPFGVRPLCLGKLDSSYVLASETCAFDLIGAEYVRDIAPGEVLKIEDGNTYSFHLPPAPRHAHCIFEHVYFSRPDSRVFGRTVHKSRYLMGLQLAIEAPVQADLVVPIPDSGLTAALGYAEKTEIPFNYGLIRNHYVGRTFIEPEQSIRHFGVKIKLNPVKELLENRRVVLVDDSIVRGTTSRKIVEMVRSAGALEVHLRISSPPTIAPCYYGINTPTHKELIGANKNVEEIRQFTGADSLAYLSLEGMKKAVADQNNFCSACFDNQYPISIPPDNSQRNLFETDCQEGNQLDPESLEGQPGSSYQRLKPVHKRESVCAPEKDPKKHRQRS